MACVGRHSVRAGRAAPVLAAVVLLGIFARVGPAAEPDVAPVPPPAQVSPQELDELRARLERLERQVQAQGGANAASPAPDAVTGQATPAPSEPPALKTEWKNGFVVTSPDEDFRIHIGGRLQFDAGWDAASHAVQSGPGGIGELQDGATFRRASLRVDGTMYENISWLVEYDFANPIINDTESGSTPIGTTGFSEAWVTISALPVVGNLRVGWIGEPAGLTYSTSSRWLDFMERSPGINSFFSTSPGAMLFNWTEDERATWAVGLFHPTNNSFGFGIGNGELAGTGRLTWLPWYEDDGRELLHLGISASERQPAEGEIDLRGRPTVRTMPGALLPALADTGTLLTGSTTFLGAELAAVYGPWTVQSEWYGMMLDNAVPLGGTVGHTLFYDGAYVEVLYFLTGEYRAYSRRDGTFGRVVPSENFRLAPEAPTWGAWQVGLRYGYLDLQSHGVEGATLHDVTLGLNWFLNPNMKVQWNYELDYRISTPAGSSGLTSILGMRVAIDF